MREFEFLPDKSGHLDQQIQPYSRFYTDKPFCVNEYRLGAYFFRRKQCTGSANILQYPARAVHWIQPERAVRDDNTHPELICVHIKR